MAIQYADAVGNYPVSWNLITGCSPISAGCDHCWAAKMIVRHRDLPGYDHDNPFKPTFHPERLDQPRRWRKPWVVATCLMADWCHRSVEAEWVNCMWQIMAECDQHTFILSTKRPTTMLNNLRHLRRLDNAWFGVSVEDQRAADCREQALRHRLYGDDPDMLSRVFMNYEPALGPIDWPHFRGPCRGIIVGAESGPKARPFDPAWAEATQAACKRAGAKFYMKQLAPSMGGANWDKWPASLKHLKVRELPW